MFVYYVFYYSSRAAAAAAAAAAAPLPPGAPEFPSRIYIIYYPKKSPELRPNRRRILEEELIDRIVSCNR